MTDVFSTTDESGVELSKLVTRAQADPLQFGPIYDLYIQPIYRYIYSRVMKIPRIVFGQKILNC